MWDERDHFARWVHLVCGIGALLLSVALTYFGIRWILTDSWSRTADEFLLGGLTCLYFAARFLWYAASGRDNVNRDDF